MPQDIKFKSILDLLEVFPDEKSCHQYIAYQRWEGLMSCPHKDCKGEKAYVFKDGIRYKCSICRKIYTAKTGTFMEASKLPTIKWIMAIYLVLHKKGVSSIQLAKDIGTCQKTSWFMLQRIREGLGNESPQQLEGNVIADETFVGGKNKNRHHDKKVEKCQGRSFKDKTPVFGLMQTNEYETVLRPHKIIPAKMVEERIITKQSKVKCWVIKNTKSSSIQPLVKANVKSGSTFTSDEWHAYRGLGSIFNHQIVDHGRGQYVNESGYTSNAIEGFWALAKRSIIGIYHKTSSKHLNKYFNEFVFRYNYRNLGAQDQINAVIANMVCRLKYKNLVA